MLKTFWLLCVTAKASPILLEQKFSRPLEMNFENVAECVTEICKTTLSFRSSVILEYRSGGIEKESFLNDTVNKLSRNNIQQVIVEDLDNININPDDADWMAVRYFVNCESLMEFNLTNIHGKIKYLVILSDNVEEDCKDTLLEIGKYVANYDVTFIVKNHEDEETLNLVTFIPEIDEITCQQVVMDPETINTCWNGTLNSARLFPSKNPSNMKKCSINVGVGPLYPFAIIRNKSRFQNFDHLDESEIRGSDLELVKITAQLYNATLKYRYVKKKEENPFGQYDFLPFIMNGSLDVCAGGFYRIYGDKVAYSGVYARQAVLWMYTADRKNKTWQSLVGKVNGLYVFIIFYISYCVIWFLIRKFDEEAVTVISTLTYAWGALVGANSVPDPRSVKQKIVNLVYLNMCVHLSAYIGVQFYSFYTISEPPQMLETIDDVMNSGRSYYLDPLSKYFVFDERYMRFANESKECYTFQDCCEKSLVHKGMTILLKGIFLNYQAQTAVNDEAKVLGSTENVLTVYYEMLIRKNSQYVTRFQDIMKRLFEAGIPERFYREAIGLNVIGRAKSASDNIISNSYSCQSGCKITLEQLDGAFGLWLIGCGISACVFVFELIIIRKQRKIEL